MRRTVVALRLQEQCTVVKIEILKVNTGLSINSLKVILFALSNQSKFQNTGYLLVAIQIWIAFYPVKRQTNGFFQTWLFLKTKSVVFKLI